MNRTSQTIKTTNSQNKNNSSTCKTTTLLLSSHKALVTIPKTDQNYETTFCLVQLATVLLVNW